MLTRKISHMAESKEVHSNQHRLHTAAQWITNLVVSLAEELELLSLFVHEHAVQVAGLHGADLDGLVAPAHDLAGADVGHRRRHLAPLHDYVLGHLGSE